MKNWKKTWRKIFLLLFKRFNESQGILCKIKVHVNCTKVTEEACKELMWFIFTMFEKDKKKLYKNVKKHTKATKE